jgi:hypothetical protein
MNLRAPVAPAKVVSLTPLDNRRKLLLPHNKAEWRNRQTHGT